MDSQCATPVSWSISVRDAHTDLVLFEESPEKVLSTASIGKVLLLFRVAELVAGGSLRLTDSLIRGPQDVVADSGLWQYLRADELSVGDLCELLGAVSDNLATNVLLRQVGLGGVAATASRRGMRESVLHDRVRDTRGPADPARLSSGTAGELAHLMSGLHRGAADGDAVTGLVHGWLSKGTDLSQVASGWGLDPLAHQVVDRGLRVVNKTGTDAGVRGEAGVLTGPATSVAYAVIANWDESAGDQRDAVLARQRSIGLLLARVARGEGGQRPADLGSGEW